MAVELNLLNSNSVENIDTNFERVQTALQDAVSRSGSLPNQINSDLDMNGNDLINVAEIDAERIRINNELVVPTEFGSIPPNSITSTELADNAVTQPKMADNSVGTAEIINSNVTTDKIANLAVTTGKIDAAAVTEAKLASNAVTTAKIADANVTLAKLATEVIDYIDAGGTLKSLSDYGTVGDGVTDDTAAIQAAFDDLVEYDSLFVPAGDYLVDGNITLSTGEVMIFGKGRFIKDGTSGVKPMFLLDDFVDNVTFRDLKFDGSKSSFAAGNGVPAILGHRNTGTKVLGCNFENFIDVGVKLRQSMKTIVANCTFYNMGENGCEFRWYQNDPRTAAAWVGSLPSTYGELVVSGCHFELIGRIESIASGLVDGCGVTFDIGAGSLREGKNISITGNTFIDCLRGIFCENNEASRPFKNVSITGNSFERTRLPPDAYVKQGVGLINVVNFIIAGNSFLNLGNYDTVAEGSYNSGVTLSSNSRDGAIIGNVFLDDSGIADRMHYCIKVTSAERVRINDNNVRGASIAQIQVDVDPGTFNISVGTNLGA